MLNSVFHKYYAASITIGLDGTMLVASTKERILIWGVTFCLLATFSLTAFLICRNRRYRNTALFIFLSTLIIPVIIMPTARHESIHISRDQITIDNGSWVFPSTSVISFGQMTNVSRSIYPYKFSNLIGDDYVGWIFSRRNDTAQSIRLNAFFSAHSLTIAHYIRDRGYSVTWID